MSVIFESVDDYTVAKITSPNGGMYTVNPFEPLECVISYRNRGSNGFGITFTAGKSSKTLSVGTCGDTEKFFRTIKRSLNSSSFWAQ